MLATKKKPSKSHRIIYFVIILISVFFATWVNIRNGFMEFVEWGGFWAYVMAYCQMYPFLTPLFFSNSQTPVLTIQFYYYCQQSGQCSKNTGCCLPMDEMLFNPSTSGNPTKCTSTSECTLISQIIENNPNINTWSLLASTLTQTPQYEGLFPSPPSAPGWETTASEIINIASPLVGAGIMLLVFL